ncbi:MAG: UDP-N-acetylmuramate--L-alanine ligase [Gammaproteobacteria bacterium]|nr:UDP-N-acetylmuramate--L-alanine ligase [Gammaproteobacteria bacterium]
MTEHLSQTMRRTHRIHFIGIGGAGMSGIAEVLHNLGYKVTGSDLKRSSNVQRLVNLGIQIYIGHEESQSRKADVVVISSAIHPDNPEVVDAHARRVPVIPRAQMLAELMRFRYGITVAGTHGKTTTTSLLATIFAEAGLKPTFVVGGKVTSAGANARLGEGHYFIAEADESDASFLHLTPMISVVTNIDADHMNTYENDFSKLRATFLRFIQRLPFYGLAVMCIDDPEIKNILPDITCSVITYGFSEGSDYRAINFFQNGLQSEFTVIYGKTRNKSFKVKLNLAGEHNVRNALASIAVALDCNIPISRIKKALAQFSGVERRCQQYGKVMIRGKSVLLIDDYGHHPAEIRVTYQALKNAFPNRRVILAFQPHRYSRTQELFDDFVEVLSQVDLLLLLEVYSAGENPIANVDSKALSRSIRQRNRIDPIYVKDIKGALDLIPDIIQEDDIILTQGAGDVDQILIQLKKLANRKIKKIKS